MKAIGFNAGQYGDLAMCTVLARAFKEQNPDTHFTMGIGNRYGDVAELFHHEPYINNVHVWDSYNEWPNSNDMSYIIQQKYDKIFEAMPQHTRNDWYLHKHQVQELFDIFGLQSNSLKIKLSRWWEAEESKRPYVCLALDSSMPGKAYTKNIGPILELIKSKGYRSVQLRGPSDKPIGCDYVYAGEYWKSVRAMADAKLLVTVDTGMSWFASGYDQHVVGLYGYKHYQEAKTSLNWQPINPNAIYLERDYAGNIPESDILAAIESKLT